MHIKLCDTVNVMKKLTIFLSKTFLISSDDNNESYSPFNWFLNQILIPKTWVRKVENQKIEKIRLSQFKIFNT